MMNFLDLFVILWLVMLILASAKVCIIIHKYISNKAPIEVTIIDLVYQDCIVYIFLLMLTFSVSFIACLLSPDLTLDFWLALTYSILIYLWFGCLASSMCVSSSLRLITLLRMSEEAGIQMLGSDDQAIKVIRASSFVASSGFIFIAVFILNSYPPAVPVLMGSQVATLGAMLKQDYGILLYFALPILSVLVNASTSVVSDYERY